MKFLIVILACVLNGIFWGKVVPQQPLSMILSGVGGLIIGYSFTFLFNRRR